MSGGDKKPEEVALKEAEAGDAHATAVRGGAGGNDGTDGGVIASAGGMDKKKVGLLAGAVAVLVAVVVIVVIVTTSGSKDKCEDDGFEGVWYSRGGEDVYLKYKFVVKNEEEGEYYGHANAAKACRDAGAELWEVTGGKEEWDAVSKFMDRPAYRREGFWLNAQVDENCPAGVAASCKSEEARLGQGLRVIWPSTGQPSTYSRLNGGANTTCININEDRLWSKVGCEDGYIAPCIKRECAMPETDTPKAEHSMKDGEDE